MQKVQITSFKTVGRRLTKDGNKEYAMINCEALVDGVEVGVRFNMEAAKVRDRDFMETFINTVLHQEFETEDLKWVAPGNYYNSETEENHPYEGHFRLKKIGRNFNKISPNLFPKQSFMDMLEGF